MTPIRGKILGVDYGAAKVGLAISSEDAGFVFGRGVVRRESDDKLVEHLKALCLQENIISVVVGFPLNAKGEKGDAAKKVEALAEKLRDHLKLPVILEDERMSTGLAKILQREAGKKRMPDDEESARIILQSYLDRIHHRQPL